MQPYLLTALSAIAGLAGAATNPEQFCGVERSVLSSLHEIPTASAFCSKYLSIGTCTKTSTKTTAIPTTTVTVQKTAASGTTVATATTTETTSFSTTTITISTSTQGTTTTTSTVTFTYDITDTCLSTGTIYTPTQEAPSPSTVTEVKRAGEAQLTPDCLKPLPSASISKACSCLSIKKPETTVVVTKTIQSGATTTTATDFVQATSTATTTITPATTVYTTITSTLTSATVTQISSTTMAPAQPSLAGLNWYFFQSTYSYEYDGGNGNMNFDPSVFDNNPGYSYSGTDLGDANYWETAGYPYSSSFACYMPSGAYVSDCGQVAVVMQGFVYATQGAGNYTFSTPESAVDDIFFVWSGETAYEYFTNSTADYVAYRNYASGTITYELEEAQFLPITMMWANTKGHGTASVQITTPDGTVNTDTSNFFMPPCIDTAFTP